MFYMRWLREWLFLFWRREDRVLMYWINFLFAWVVLPFYLWDFLFTDPHKLRSLSKTRYVVEDD